MTRWSRPPSRPAEMCAWTVHYCDSYGDEWELPTLAPAACGADEVWYRVRRQFDRVGAHRWRIVAVDPR